MQQVFYALSDLPSPISVSLLLHYVDIPKFIDLFPDEEPLSCLQYGAIMINAAMNICVMGFFVDINFQFIWIIKRVVSLPYENTIFILMRNCLS